MKASSGPLAFLNSYSPVEFPTGTRINHLWCRSTGKEQKLEASVNLVAAQFDDYVAKLTPDGAGGYVGRSIEGQVVSIEVDTEHRRVYIFYART